MKALVATLAGVGILSVLTLGEAVDAPPAGLALALGEPLPAERAAPPAPPSDAELTAVIRRTCVQCHNDQMLTGNLSLQTFDVAKAAERAEVAEKMIGKLRTEMMPPPRMPRPAGDTLAQLAQTLENKLDAYWDDRPNPGARPFQRLNRREYERAIEDVLGLHVNAGDWLPLDQFQANFDNMAFVQGMSATLLTSYLNAAADISRLAIGQPNAPPLSRSYGLPESVSQHQWEHVEGAPYGTRGGIVVTHEFPADGLYEFDLSFYGGGTQAWFEEIDISIDGDNLASIPYSADALEQYAANQLMHAGRFPVTAGEHRVSVSFARTMEGPYEDLIRPLDGGHAGRSAYGTTGFPHLRDVTIIGPHEASGVSSNPVRDRILSCRPATPAEERPCAESIIRPIATRAFRRTVSDADLEAILGFYDMGTQEGGFEGGVRTAIEAVLASPQFVFRLEREPEDVEVGESYEVDDFDLASRLSFFIWGTIPDETLLDAAERGRLSNRGELERQARRMLADPRSEALGERFAAQWLRLQDMVKVQPDLFWYPDFTKQLEADMRRETVMFFNNLVREDRSILELYNAKYTFVNERLASHYGIRGVTGDEFRRVAYPEASGRAGILGQGSVQLLTSMGNRTSPVLRGKWVMEVLLGTPPPPPPANVPPLEQTSQEGADGRLLSGRERLAIHRASPVCAACHQYMDPIGVALENFDVDGTYRIRERDLGLGVDSRGTLYDGTNITSQAELVDALLARPTPLLRTFTTNLMAYSLGRRIEYFDQPAIRAIVREAEENDYRLSSFILGVVMSDQFRLRTAAPATANQ